MGPYSLFVCHVRLVNRVFTSDAYQMNRSAVVKVLRTTYIKHFVNV